MLLSRRSFIWCARANLAGSVETGIIGRSTNQLRTSKDWKFLYRKRKTIFNWKEKNNHSHSFASHAHFSQKLKVNFSSNYASLNQSQHIFELEVLIKFKRTAANNFFNRAFHFLFWWLFSLKNLKEMSFNVFLYQQIQGKPHEYCDQN